MQEAPPSRGIFSLLANSRQTDSLRTGAPHHRGQLRDTQTCQCQKMAETPHASAVAFYSDKLLLVESGGAVFWFTDRQGLTTRGVYVG